MCRISRVTRCSLPVRMNESLRLNTLLVYHHVYHHVSHHGIPLLTDTQHLCTACFRTASPLLHTQHTGCVKGDFLNNMPAFMWARFSSAKKAEWTPLATFPNLNRAQCTAKCDADVDCATFELGFDYLEPVPWECLDGKMATDIVRGTPCQLTNGCDQKACQKHCEDLPTCKAYDWSPTPGPQQCQTSIYSAKSEPTAVTYIETWGLAYESMDCKPDSGWLGVYDVSYCQRVCSHRGDMFAIIHEPSGQCKCSRQCETMNPMVGWTVYEAARQGDFAISDKRESEK